MKLTQLQPILYVPDVRQTIDWYVTNLFFTEKNYNEELGWGVVKKDDVLVMLSKPNDHIPFSGSHFTGSFYINIDDVIALWELLKDKPFVYYKLETFEYGMREFAIKDCNGYIIQFGQDMISGL